MTWLQEHWFIEAILIIVGSLFVVWIVSWWVDQFNNK
jgi:hypothetical protein